MRMPVTNGGAVLGVGIDIVDIPRICDSHKRHGERFLNKIFTASEQAYCLNYKNPYPSLSARFAAKEAVSKAFTTGIGGEIGFTDIEVFSGVNGEPLIRLGEKGEVLLKKIGGTGVLISLSHTADLATAIAVVVG